MAISPATKARKEADREAKKLEKNEAARRKKEENAKSKGKVWNPSTKRWVSEATLKKHQQKFEFKPRVQSTLATPTFQKKFNIPKKPLYSKPPGGRRVDFKSNNNVREISNIFLSHATPTTSLPYSSTKTFRSSRSKPRPNINNPQFMQSRYVNKFTERQSRVKHASNNLDKQQTRLKIAQQNKNRVQQEILRETRKKDEINNFIKKSKSRITNLEEKLKAESNRLYAHSTVGRGL
jgi:hypothetical protein